MSNDDHWKRLPIEGLKLDRMILHGCGKDCQLTVVVEGDHPNLEIVMRDPGLECSVSGRPETHSFNHGDSDLGILYRPLEPLSISRAELRWPGNEDEWRASLANYANGRRNWIGYTIMHVRLSLVGEAT